MSSYIVARLLRALVTVFLVLSFAFVILRLSGDPALLIMSPDVPPEAIEAFRRSWGLDASLWQQYPGFLPQPAPSPIRFLEARPHPRDGAAHAASARHIGHHAAGFCAQADARHSRRHVRCLAPQFGH